MDLVQQLHLHDPYFPPELEREIFETAAILYPTTLPKLLRVARRVLSWLEPMLYNMIQIMGLEKKRESHIALLRVIDMKPDFFPHAVRHMYLFPVHWSFFCAPPSKDAWTDLELHKVLRACASVVDIVVIGNPTTPLLLPMLEMRPKRLAMFFGAQDRGIDLSLPFFRNISHFLFSDCDEQDTDLDLDSSQFRNLCRLPVLTHVALTLKHIATSAQMLSVILSDFPHLQALLILSGNESTARALAEDVTLNDQRIVIMSGETLNEDWYYGTQGRPDIWARADAFISGKRKGEISRSRYYLESLDTPAPATQVSADRPTTAQPASIVTPPVLRVTAKLEKELFDYAALLHPEMIPTLLRVARRVRDWQVLLSSRRFISLTFLCRIEPLLYVQILITTHTPRNKADLVIQRAIQSKPAQFFADAVRQVVLKTLPWDDPDSGETWSDAELSKALALCTGATSVVLIGDLFEPRLVPMLAFMQPTHLRVAADVFAPGNSNPPRFNLPFLQRVSHVHLFETDVHLFDSDASVSANWEYWSHLSRLPALTHLVIPCQTDIIPTILSDLPNLQTLILVADIFVDGDWISRHLPVLDQRIVVVQATSDFDPQCSVDFWERADSFMVQKRRGVIQASCYYLDST
ncbi:hypothetical protein FB451DRAFT_1371429 [Mycena latifolia]|nr:hypothetical protein FB451DRAFT_1371429 [Mycena latifolia]